MNPDEYDQQLRAQISTGTPPVKALESVLTSFLRETEALRKKRRAVTAFAYAAVLRQQSSKWRALANKNEMVAADAYFRAQKYRYQLHKDAAGWTALTSAGFTR